MNEVTMPTATPHVAATPMAIEAAMADRKLNANVLEKVTRGQKLAAIPATNRGPTRAVRLTNPGAIRIGRVKGA
jgi:hypothetical protein